MRRVRQTIDQDRTDYGIETVCGREPERGGEENKMEVMREEEVVRLEEAIVRKLEDRLHAQLHQSAVDAAKTVMNQVRLDLMRHISRHEKLLTELQRATAALDKIPEHVRRVGNPALYRHGRIPLSLVWKACRSTTEETVPRRR